MKKTDIELISLSEAARRTDQARQTIHRLVKRGQLQTYRLRRKNGKLSAPYIEWPLTLHIVASQPPEPRVWGEAPSLRVVPDA